MKNSLIWLLSLLTCFSMSACSNNTNPKSSKFCDNWSKLSSVVQTVHQAGVSKQSYLENLLFDQNPKSKKSIAVKWLANEAWEQPIGDNRSAQNAIAEKFSDKQYRECLNGKIFSDG